MTADYSYCRQGRARRTAVIIAAVYGVCIAAIVFLDAAWWSMAMIALTTIPALLDLWFNPQSGLEISQTQLTWFTGRRRGTLSLDEIDRMRFDTRWDWSVRVTAILTNKKRIRLPYETLPPHRQLEAEFQRRNIQVVRHHFVVI